ncbi:hypothetical protein H5410_029878 [Solanum commersonii]|uniref:Uncharacterized protein n=1 Tax=Solanum commersonii TaxID=4109 RepID=A0A9J5YH01_SOLCO|nr:hypothetical protein H5410_029878 [Solanum commersonii]
MGKRTAMANQRWMKQTSTSVLTNFRIPSLFWKTNDTKSSKMNEAQRQRKQKMTEISPHTDKQINNATDPSKEYRSNDTNCKTAKFVVRQLD